MAHPGTRTAMGLALGGALYLIGLALLLIAGLAVAARRDAAKSETSREEIGA